MLRRPQGNPIGEAMVWVSRILAVGLAMFLPGVAGGWVDDRIGTRFLGLLGIVLGVAVALMWLVRLTGPTRRRPS